MGIAEALEVYWTSPIPIAILLVCLASIVTLLYVFVTNRRNARLRVSVLSGLYSLSLFFWLFIALSLALCIIQFRTVAYRSYGVQLAAAGAVIAGVAGSAIVTLVVWRHGPGRVLGRLDPKPLSPKYRDLQAYADLIASFEDLPPIKVVESDRREPIALALGGPTPVIVVSAGLLEALDAEERETVVAHELMHLRNHDARFKLFSTVLSRAMFFDPFSKFFDPAVHREREYLADEMSGRSTGNPAALASALLKLSGRGGRYRPTWGLSILGDDRGVFSRYPPLRDRVRRLLLLSEILRHPPAAQGPGPALLLE